MHTNSKFHGETADKPIDLGISDFQTKPFGIAINHIVATLL